MAARSRGWQFTLNNYTDADEVDIQAIQSVYLIYGREVAPTTGTPHLQGFIKFGLVKSFKQVKSLLPVAAHIEPALCEEALINYNAKDGDIFEKGVRPKSNREKGLSTQERYRAAISCAKEGKIDEVDPDLYLRYYRTLKVIEKDHLKPCAPLDTTAGVWIFGPSGCGKTSYVHKQFGESLYIKSAKTKWWDSYQGQDYVLLDDMDYECLHMSYYLKIWADHYPFQAETKGSAIMIRPKKIIVTSNYMIHELWREPELVKALVRRFELVDMRYN